MNYDQAYAAFDGALPRDLQQEMFHGGWRRFCRAAARTAEKNLLLRFQDILRALCVWRRHAPYDDVLREKMLVVLSRNLCEARIAALRATLVRLLGDGGDGAAHQHDIGRGVNPHHQ